MGTATHSATTPPCSTPARTQPCWRRAATIVPRDRVHTYLNASREQASAIKRAGLIPTLLEVTGTSKALARQFRPADLDAFLARLCAETQEVGRRDTGAMTIQRAASRAGCDTATVVHLILDRKLPWVGRRKGVRGLRAVVVHPAHVSAFLEGGSGCSWSPTALANEFRLKGHVVDRLMTAGILPSRTLARRADGRAVRMIDDEDVRRFRETYFWTGDRGGGSAVALRPGNPVTLGVRPALRRKEFGRDFYLKLDVAGPEDVCG